MVFWMTEKKMVSRNLTIAVGTLCFILAAIVAGLVPALFNYMLMVSSNMSSKDSEIAFLNFQITNLYGQIKQYLTYLNGNKTLLSQTQTWLNNNITSYNAQISDLQNITMLQYVTVFFNQTVFNPHWHDYAGDVVWQNIPSTPDLGINIDGKPIPIQYAGYLMVNIVSSSSNSTSVQVTYSSSYLNYNNTLSTGSSGIAYFPILPTTSLDVKLINTDLTDLNITRVTITYYY
jgi:hypothetical protein